jgi:hypothetical protein
MMKCLSVALVASITLLVAVSASAQDGLCVPLRAFAASVKQGETKQLEFHTSWLKGFKDDSSPSRTMVAKRCIDHGYAPAKAVCAYLLDNGAVEFAGNNVKRALECLSNTKFSPSLQLYSGEFHFSYGREQRGTNITISFNEDQKIGGEVMTITADG